MIAIDIYLWMWDKKMQKVHPQTLS